MQRYFSEHLNNNHFLLKEDDLFHIKKVMRIKDNDKIEVVYKGEVYECNYEKNKAKILFKKNINNELKKEIILVIPLLKEQKMDLILQKSTELGVSKIIPAIMNRSIIKIDKNKEEKKLERWSKICKEASEQSKRNRIPVITKIKKIDEIDDTGLKIICSTKEHKNNIKKFLQSKNNYDRIILVIGPEGGLTEEEENILNNKGFYSLSLGDRIMRVETVPIFLLSILNYEFMG